LTLDQHVELTLFARVVTEGGHHPTGFTTRAARSKAVLDVSAIVVGLDDITMMEQTIEERRGHFPITEDYGYFPTGRLLVTTRIQGILLDPAGEIE